MKIYDISTGKLSLKAQTFCEILEDKDSLWKPVKGQLAILKNSGIMIVAIADATNEAKISELKASGTVLYGPAFVGSSD